MRRDGIRNERKMHQHAQLLSNLLHLGFIRHCMLIDRQCWNSAECERHSEMGQGGQVCSFCTDED